LAVDVMTKKVTRLAIVLVVIALVLAITRADGPPLEFNAPSQR
jgi:hypothetical protein